VAPLHAQARVRLEPSPLVFDPGPDPANPARTRRMSLDLYIDDIPSSGLGSFRVYIDTRRRHTDGAPCITYDASYTVDPNFKAAWNNLAQISVGYSQDRTLFAVFANAVNQGSLPLPTGTIHFGSFVLKGVSGLGCSNKLQDEFVVDAGSSSWGPSSPPRQAFVSPAGSAWAWTALPDLDLTIACQRTSPPAGSTFVDGDVLTLECDAANLGTDAVSLVPIIHTVTSADSIVDAMDPLLYRSVGAGQIGGGEVVHLTLTGQPMLTTPQTVNICTKIDVDESGIDLGWGPMLETDETNNTDCSSLTIVEPHRDLVVVPGSVSLTPDPSSPGGLFRAGLPLHVDYDALNQGNGAVRTSHRQVVRLGTTLQSALADPNAILCGVNVDLSVPPPLAGGSSLHESFGLGTGTSPEICKIPFSKPPGSYVLVVQLDSNNKVAETDPNGNAAPAESNNAIAVPITVDLPLDPQFRVQHKSGDPSDQILEIFGPNNGTMYVAAASVRSLTAYSLRLSWSPAKLMYAGTPGGPGDPNRVVFTNFLASRGLAQSCAVTAIDPN
ncbi:MAG TPA: hypothetical protein VNI57_10765, partial [Candidatus Saccharimonadales bacterium]|nr:hypothetical protein [Candidatus Saccharimonadales bacterium]